MMQVRTMIHAMMFSLLSVVWITSGLSLANETRPVKSAPAPVPAKPRVAARAANATGRRHPGDVPKPTRAPHLPAAIIGHDGAPMVLVPAGEFPMGSDEGDDDEQPVHRVLLDSFYIDTFEVTNGRFAKFVEAIQSEPPWGFADPETPVVDAARPVRWVN